MKTKLITARVDQNVCDQIAYLKKELGERTTTNIVTEAVKCLYDSVKHQESQKSPFEMLEELDLIGCFDGEPTLSTDYKKALSDSLEQKYHSLKSKKK